RQDCMAGYAIEKDIDAMAEHLTGNGIPSVIARAIAGGFPSAFGSDGADLSARPLPIFFGRHQVHTALDKGLSQATPTAGAAA
ncbi:MAG: hypothetical protein AAFW74_15490, partial [Pseudomonadota bacterium]